MLLSRRCSLLLAIAVWCSGLALVVGGCEADPSLTDGVCAEDQCRELGCVTGSNTYWRKCGDIEKELKVWRVGG